MTIKEKIFYEKLFCILFQIIFAATFITAASLLLGNKFTLQQQVYSSATLMSVVKHMALQSSVLRSRMATVCDFWKDGTVNSRVFCPFESKS